MRYQDGVAQLTKALSNEWAGKVADNSIDPWLFCCFKMKVVDGGVDESRISTDSMLDRILAANQGHVSEGFERRFCEFLLGSLMEAG